MQMPARGFLIAVCVGLCGLAIFACAQTTSPLPFTANKEQEMTELFEFEVLKAANGPFYERAKERWWDVIARSRPLLEDRAKAQDWETAMNAKILMAWMDHQTTYQAFLAMLNAEDVAAARRTIMGLNLIWDKYQGLAMEQYKTKILPLCWEVLLKHSADWPMWKQVTILRMVEVVPHPDSLEPLIWYMENTPDPAMAHSAAMALLQLPKELVEKRLAHVKLKYNHILQLIGELKEEYDEKGN